ncbi:DNA-binding transcriptional regulator, LysR family [Reichenbachiella faecimaris]|uniref:DNA-binding transcriptional regulator, LysR family n=1 Tax=Reichenbachiella faecimaris TaxID=692418 RepID=A0A1W2G8D1_REIFA|nr:LysR family transcriptional regulator [Reichenbachiella faecimaris]SMD32588.1 DNA-binding transcriptional regulator, LysR family [Reichenbachiella faecimaris]
MINLEWLRTFRAVYKTKSLSQAAEMLSVSQPTVSQQISALESRMGKKLFERKSKGVIETDVGRMLNTMISGSIEALEGVEHNIIKSDASLKNILTIGVSPHLYKTAFCQRILELGEYVHLTFGTRQQLIRDVEEGNLLYAIVPEEQNTFDTYCHHLTAQNVVLVGTPEIDFSELEKLYKKSHQMAQDWLAQYKWYAHDHNSSFIKVYWLNVFDKKRPAIVPNYVIPNEFETLFQQTRGSGLSIAFDTVVEHFVNEGTLQTCQLKKIPYRELYLIANKKKTKSKVTEEVLKILKKINQHTPA